MQEEGGGGNNPKGVKWGGGGGSKKTRRKLKNKQTFIQTHTEIQKRMETHLFTIYQKRERETKIGGKRNKNCNIHIYFFF